MPSDTSGHQPLATLVRGAPDWFDDNVATGGAHYLLDPPAGNTYASISLFNDSTTGAVFKVYGLSFGNDVFGVTYAYMRQGTPLGTFQGQCRNIRPDLGSPFGQIWMKLDVTAFDGLYPLPLPDAPTMLGAEFGRTMTSPFPLFIVPVGWSLVIANGEGADDVFAGFWYQQANE